MPSTQSNNNIIAPHIDMATFDVFESDFYGGDSATVYFVECNTKCSWFSQIPVTLRASNQGTINFGNDIDISITRNSDYLLYVWARIELAEVQCKGILTGVEGAPVHGNTASVVRACRNIGHNIFDECRLVFADITAQDFDNYWMDLNSEFSLSYNKRNGYHNMIGNILELTNPMFNKDVAASVGFHYSLPASVLNVPLPYFFSQNFGKALPAAAIPYADPKFQMDLAEWNKLYVADDYTYDDGAHGGAHAGHAGWYWHGSRPAADGDFTTVPRIYKFQLWANYASVTNPERKKMGKITRDILIDRVQSPNENTYNPAEEKPITLNLTHAIKGIYFAIANVTNTAERSCYTVSRPTYSLDLNNGTMDFDNAYATDPILTVTLTYDAVERFNKMPIDYFSFVAPFFQPGLGIPEVTGYHMYSYALDITSPDVTGSTNYTLLNDVTMTLEPTTAVQEGASGALGHNLHLLYDDLTDNAIEQYKYVFRAPSWTTIQISGGSVGFPNAV